MRHLFILSFFILIISNSSAQSTFIKVYSDPNPSRSLLGRHVVQTNDGNFSFLTTNGNNPIVIRVDDSGNEFRRFDVPHIKVNPVCLAVNDQDEYFYVGRDSLDYTGYREKTDSSGNEIYFQDEWGAVGGATAYGVHRAPDNNILYHFRSNDEMCYDPNKYFTLGSNGWYSHEYVSSSNIPNPLKQSFQFMDSGKICTIAIQMIGCYDTVQYYSSNLIIHDSMGGRTVYNYQDLYQAIDTVYDGGFIVASSGQIARLDSTGGFIWTIPMPVAISDQFSILQMADSSFLLTGDISMSGLGRQLVAYKYDRNGNLLWNKDYGSVGHEIFSNVILTDDGGFLISGTTYGYNALVRNAILVKADNLGNSGTMPIINASSTSVICSGGSTMLSLPQGYTYLWSNGSTDQTINVTVAGSYSATLNDGINTYYTDTITLNVVQTVKPDLGNDTTLCAGSILYLNGGPGYSSYRWSNGVFDMTGVIDWGGDYILEAIDSNSCSTFDTIHVTSIVIPSFSLGPDISQCDTTPIVLQSPGILTWEWSDGSTDSTFEVHSSGVYAVTVRDGLCAASDSINISIFQPASVDIIEDTTLCVGQQLIIDAGLGYASYLWQDNSFLNFFLATSHIPASYQYSVEVTDSNGCHASDDVVVDFIICTSVDENEFESNISVYPNPVHSAERIIIDSKNENIESIEVVSVTGKVLLKENVKELPVNISIENFDSGIYFIRVKSSANDILGIYKFVIL